MNKRTLTAKQARKKNKIMEVAIQLFVKYGIQGTSMQLLAKRADVATGSIYNYFSDKETLIKEIFVSLLNEEVAYLLEGYDDSRSIRQRFDYLVSRSVIFKAKYPDKLKFRQQYIYAQGIMTTLDDIGAAYFNSPFRFLGEDGVAQGIFKPLSLEEMLYFCQGAMNGFVSWHIFHHGNVSDEATQCVTELIWDSLAIQQGENG